MPELTPPGGGFLLAQTSPDDVFTPEEFTDEHRLIRDVAERFVSEEVLPQLDAIEHQQWDVTVKLLRRCGEIGLLGIEAPEKYGGSNLDRVSAALVAEQMARVLSFAVSFGGQSGIGVLPIVYFGSDAIKAKYLPPLVSGELLSAYALSEASSGSDALSARTTAQRDSTGRQWILNGEKMWITSAAFADLFMVFAKVDSTEFTCFAVERTRPGVSTGAEERKMGLKGSSTRALLLDNAQIPIDSVIGDVGRGRQVAFNILNIGRAKLAASTLGAGKAALNESIRYALGRVAFGRAIARFGAIQSKLAEMAIRAWTTESMVYRATASMDRALLSVDATIPEQALRAIEEYAIECSTLKVYGSEALDFIVDEAVQIHGGYGYSAEYAVERYYRDSRVHRIFEGTNEINRLIIFGMMLKRGAAGRLALHDAVGAATGDVWARNPVSVADGPFRNERAAVEQARNAFLFTAGLALNKHAEGVREEQELVMRFADIAIDIYAMDTALARVMKRHSASDVERATVQVFVDGAIARTLRSATQILTAVTSGDQRSAAVDALRQTMDWAPVDTIRASRVIAESLLDHGRYLS